MKTEELFLLKYFQFFIKFYDLNYHFLEELFQDLINESLEIKMNTFLFEFGLDKVKLNS